MPDRLPNWQRSAKCESAACVEVALIDGAVLIRNSRHPDGPVLRFDTEEWKAFCLGIADGELCSPGT